jgi:branched-chain amino acid transport system permease protein
MHDPVESPETSVAELIRTHEASAGAAADTSKGASKVSKRIALAVGAVLVVIFGLAGPGADVYVADFALLACIGAIGLNLLTGFAGQVSVGSSAFLAVGAFTYVGVYRFGGLAIAILASALLCAVVGLLSGLPSLRLQGFYLVLSTLALFYIADFVVEKIQFGAGAIGGFVLPEAQFLGWHINSDQQWYFFLLVTVALVLAGSWNLKRSKFGRAWAGIKENELATRVIGVNLTSMKLTAFTFSSALIGIQGALTAAFVQNVSYDNFTLDQAVSYVVMILIGGLGSVWGPIIGAAVVTVLPTVISDIGTQLPANIGTTVSSDLANIELAIYGAVVLAFLLREPRGIAHLIERAAAQLAQRGRTRGGEEHD